MPGMGGAPQTDDPIRPGRKVVLAVAATVALSAALAAGLLVGDSATQTATSGESWPSVALSSSFVTPAGSWAILPMGHLSDPLNTFWQLFFRGDGQTEWKLVTPPGVADNGGLAASPGEQGSVTIVFEPTNLLTFSPFAITSDDGRTWSGGVIPFGTPSVPDVFTAPSSAGVQFAALDGGASTVAVGNGVESSWSTRSTKDQVAQSQAGRSCGVAGLTALTAYDGGELLGSSCTNPGVVGLFRGAVSGSASDGLQLVGPDLGASAGKFERSPADGSGEPARSALVDGRRGSLNDLYALRGDGESSSWSASQPLALGPGSEIVSSGFGPDGALVVETRSASGALEAATTGAEGDKSWRDLPRLPADTESVSIGVDGKVDALSRECVSSTDWYLDSGAWTKIQLLTVPIQYGSSS